MEGLRLRKIQKQKITTPVGFGLFALTVDQPQVILGLLWTGLGVQVSHADRLVRRGHAGQHSRWSADITKRRVWGCVHHRWLVSSLWCFWKTEKNEGWDEYSLCVTVCRTMCASKHKKVKCHSLGTITWVTGSTGTKILKWEQKIYVCNFKCVHVLIQSIMLKADCGLYLASFTPLLCFLPSSHLLL